MFFGQISSNFKIFVINGECMLEETIEKLFSFRYINIKISYWDVFLKKCQVG